MKLTPGSTSDQWSRHPFISRLQGYISLNNKELNDLWRLIDEERAAQKHTDLVVDGYEYRKLCFIENGFAARYKLLRNGKRQIISVLVPGDVVGIPGSFLEKAIYSVIALTDLTMHVCAVDAYVQLCYKQPKFGLILSWLAVQEAINYAEHMINAGRRTPAERLAHFLLEIHSRLARIDRAQKSGFCLPFSQEVIGDAVGLSVPHVNRTLAKLRKDGLITVQDRYVEFTDRGALELLGQVDSLNLTRIPQLLV